MNKTWTLSEIYFCFIWNLFIFLVAEVQHITEEVSVEMKYNVWLKVEARKSILALEPN